MDKGGIDNATTGTLTGKAMGAYTDKVKEAMLGRCEINEELTSSGLYRIARGERNHTGNMLTISEITFNSGLLVIRYLWKS